MPIVYAIPDFLLSGPSSQAKRGPPPLSPSHRTPTYTCKVYLKVLVLSININYQKSKDLKHSAPTGEGNCSKPRQNGGNRRTASTCISCICVNGGSYTMCDITHQCSCGQWICKPSFKLIIKQISEKSRFEFRCCGDGNYISQTKRGDGNSVSRRG